MKKITFVILSYNSEHFLNNCLSSIYSVKNYDTNVIVVDNGSKDESVKIIKSFENKGIQLIQLEKNYGTTYSRNLALKTIKETDYICVLDSDTIINEKALIEMTDVLDKHDDIGICGPSMVNGKGEKQISYRRFPTWKIKLLKAIPIKSLNKKGEKLENYDIGRFLEKFECDYLISACWLMKYKNFKKIGFFDEKIFYAPEDVDYCMKAAEENLKVAYVNKAQIVHYYQRISKKKLISKVNFSHIMGIHYVLRKHKKLLKSRRKK